jgi:hypothetical protein
MKFVLFLISMVLFSSWNLSGQDRSEWFEFYLPWDDTIASITNLSAFLDAPAGKHGFVQVTPDGHFKFENLDERIRFTGVVNVAISNFPGSEQSRILAARMAKFGINLVRIHLIDVDGQYGLFQNSAINTTELSKDKFNRMDYFVNCLKDKGIYYNFCIHSGRIYKAGDTIDAVIQNNQSKYSTLFNQRLITLQKNYARQTLAHVNPYTGLSYADDPGMMSVELTNENSLFNGWFGWQTDYLFADNPDGIGEYYSRELDSLFNDWLTEKYIEDSSLIEAWAGDSFMGSELVKNQSFEDGLNQWSKYVHTAGGAAATIQIDTANPAHGLQSLKIEVTAGGTETWHIQVKTNNFSVTKSKDYKVSFYARTNATGIPRIQIMENNTWDWIGGPSYTPSAEWEKFEFFFTANKNTDALIIQFDWGLLSGTYWLDSVSVVQTGGTGLENGESLALRNVKRIKQVNIGKYSARRTGDNAEFYFDLEGRYIKTLTDYLKDSLKIKCPVTFTNNYYGLASIYSQSRADYMDTHFYWDHPNFPHGWSDSDFTMQNRSMVLNPEGSTLNHMPLGRVKGLPLVLSEYNHPYPYIFQAEAPSMLYAYGSFFDLDGIIWHAYYDYHNRFTQRYQDMFFDIAMNPVIMTQLMLAVPYRMGYIKSADQYVYAHYREQDIFDNTKLYQDNNELNMSDGDYGRTFLQQGFAHESFQSDSTYLEGKLSRPGNNFSTMNGEINWDGNKGVFRINNPYWQGATGYLKGSTINLNDIMLSDISTTDNLDFASVQLISMDSLPISKSKKLLLLTSARLENEGFLWNAEKTSPVSLGGTRALCEPVSGNLTLKFALRDSFYVYSLDERGIRKNLLTTDPDNLPRITFNEKTLWYEILNDSTRASYPGITKRDAVHDYHLANYPNPCNDYTVIEFELPDEQRVELLLYSSDGKVLQSGKLSVLKDRLMRTELNTSDYSHGLYFYGLRLENGQMILNRLVIAD